MPEPLPDRVARASDRSAASAGRAAWPSPRRSHLPPPLRRPTASPPTSNAAAGHKSRSPIQLSSTTAGSTAGSAERHHQAPQHKAAYAGCVRIQQRCEESFRSAAANGRRRDSSHGVVAGRQAATAPNRSIGRVAGFSSRSDDDFAIRPAIEKPSSAGGKHWLSEYLRRFSRIGAGILVTARP